MLRIAHLSDLHVGHLSANLIRLGRLLLPRTRGEGAWDVVTRLLASSWVDRRSLSEPLVRAAHLTHAYETRNLVAVVQSVREQGCDHVILTGDLANLGASSEMLEARAVLDAFGYAAGRLTVVPGNHDVVNFDGVAEFQKVMRQDAWPHLDRISDDVAALAIDTTAHGEALDWRDALTMNARGVISDEDLEKADALLASVPAGVFKILCCHHHLVDLPPDGYSDEFTGRIDPRLAGRAANADRLIQIAKARGVGQILFGHRHHATHHLFRIRSVPASCSGSVTEVDRRGRLRYRIFDFDGPRVIRRRWIETSPRDARRDVVLRALEGISSVKDDEDLKLTQRISLGHFERDMERLQKRKKELDRKIVARVRERMASETGERGTGDRE
jgi:3',5'-cyclic AMP phosphodiesterase CpdA